MTVTPRRRAAPLVCSTADSTAARRSSGRRSSRTSPESSLDSSSRFWASQSSRSICWPLDSRNSSRASGSSPAPSRQQLVERPEGGQRRPQLVRDVGQEVAAPVAVAADDLDALLEPVGHGVELDGQLGHLGRAGADLALGHAPGQVALGQAARGLGQAAQRGREAAGHGRRHEHAQPEREQGDRGQQPGDVGQRGRPERVRVGQRDLDRVRREHRPPAP